MTAEIAIMNKTGIALAADSAVTISSENDNKKIYNSANKLFALSRYSPVGIMVFDSTELMRMPWETIIKLYRKKLGRKSFPYVANYCEDFFRFIEEDINLKEGEEEHITRVSISVFAHIVKEIDNEVKAEIDRTQKINTKIIGSIVKDTVDLVDKEFNESLEHDNPASNEIIPLLNEYESKFDELIGHFFEKRPISKDVRKKLHKLAAKVCVMGNGLSNSGVVIAGFGDGEYYPAVYSYDVGKCLLKK